MNIIMEWIKPGTIIAVTTMLISMGVTYGAISNRINALEGNQITKEDIRYIVKENNVELLNIIDTRIALAIEKKN